MNIVMVWVLFTRLDRSRTRNTEHQGNVVVELDKSKSQVVVLGVTGVALIASYSELYGYEDDAERG